jgi:hypothetical protein
MIPENVVVAGSCAIKQAVLQPFWRASSKSVPLSFIRFLFLGSTAGKAPA